jgi:hypothetical protein
LLDESCLPKTIPAIDVGIASPSFLSEVFYEQRFFDVDTRSVDSTFHDPVGDGNGWRGGGSTDPVIVGGNDPQYQRPVDSEAACNEAMKKSRQGENE